MISLPEAVVLGWGLFTLLVGVLVAVIASGRGDGR